MRPKQRKKSKALREFSNILGNKHVLVEIRWEDEDQLCFVFLN